MLDEVSNTNCDEYIDSQYPDRLKRSVLGTVFHWLFGRLGGTNQNVEQLKCNVDMLMANKNVQQEQIKEIFKLNNLTRVETTWNRRILKQLDVKLSTLHVGIIQLNKDLEAV